MRLYEIFDSKAKIYIELFKEETNASAIRQFTRLANDPNTMVGRFPEDYSLFEVGEWDRNTGDITPGIKMSLGVAIEYVERIDPPTQLQFNTKEEVA